MTRSAGLTLLALAALLLTVTPPTPSCAADQSGMVDAQLERRGIKDRRVLDAFRKVRREEYVPSEAREHAYDDRPIPIGHDQTISQPYIVALMTQLLDLKGDERVLEIGTGSGYQAAILAELARDVYTIEIIPELATNARLRLTREGYRNVHVKQGDGTQGWKEYAPYKAIIVTAAAPKVPQPLIDELDEGGVLVMPVGDPGGRQVLIRGIKRGGKLRSREVTDVQFVPLTSGPARAARSERQPQRKPDSATREPERKPSGAGSESAGRDGVENGDEHAPAVREHARDDDEPARERHEHVQPRRSEDVEPDAEWHRDENGDVQREEQRRHDDEEHRRFEHEERAPQRDDEWKRDERELNEDRDDRDDQDFDEPESGTRPHRGERNRVARGPDARDSDRLAAGAAGARAAARSLAAPR